MYISNVNVHCVYLHVEHRAEITLQGGQLSGEMKRRFEDVLEDCDDYLTK